MAITGFRRNLIIIALIGLAVRLICLYTALPIQLTGDEVYYANVAYNITIGCGHMFDYQTRASWPPANAYLLSAFMSHKVSRKNVLDFADLLKTMLKGQAMTGAFVVPLVMLLSNMLFGNRVALTAGIITAFYPTFIAFSHYLWAENLFIVLITASFTAAVYTEHTRKLGMAMATGVLFGLATLTREAGLVIAAACALWWVWAAGATERRRAIIRSCFMLLVAALTILPWTIRNYRALGGFVPISTVGWMAASEGNILDPDDWLHPNRDLLVRFRGSHGQIKDEIDRMKYARQVALEHISKEQPTWIFKKFVRTTAMLFSPDSFVLKKISRGSYLDIGMGTIRFLLVATVFAYIAVMIAGSLGIAAAPDHRLRSLPCLVIGSVFLIHLVANASSRYRLPLMPLLIPYAAYALIHWREIRSRLAGRKWIVPAVVLLWIFGVGIPYFFNDAVSIWKYGTYVHHWRP